MKRLLPLLGIILFITANSFSQRVAYTDSWDESGFNLKSQGTTGVNVNYSVTEFNFVDVDVRGEAMQAITMPGIFLFNDQGAPDLPGSGRYIAIPEGATAVARIVEARTETFKDVDIAPAPRIPWTNERGPLHYDKDARIYSSNAFYPAEPVRLSEVTQLRGVDAVILGVTPFQYNPVTRELIVYRDLKIEVEFTGGNGQFGEERLRSRWYDPILSDALMNYASLPEIDYDRRYQNTRATGYEYLIISPTDQVFIGWADSIKMFRNLQGIKTGIATITEVGGNTSAAIENYIDNAYHTWDIPPVAVLLLGDYGTIGSTIISPVWDNYCVSDHLYADVDGNDDEEEIIFARMTARDGDELEVMIRKALDYETDPPTNPDYYNHPITALGWQTERWFQICSETVGGYLKNVKGKDPVRINEVYDGNPAMDPWSTATNTATVMGVFGPAGLAYIPYSPSELGGWAGGNANDVNNAINNGAYLLQHRDHGGENGWGEPAYNNSHIDGLTNTDLTFIFSINCLTGKYNWSSECFAEKFHRYTYNGQPAGALGLIAASEISYSFVNDTYVWGMFDNLYPDFLPDYGSTPEPRGEMPAFGSSAGKLFLKQSSWPYNEGNKEVTYNLFHHHGDAFTCLYSEVPQQLTVAHNPVLLANLEEFTVTADEGSLICLSVNGEIIGTAEGTGSPLDIAIAPQLPPDLLDIVVTKQNYYRYHATIEIIPPSGPYVVNQAYEINDGTGNGNGQLDYGETVTLNLTLRNLGSEDATNVTATISTVDEYTTITDNTAEYGSIPTDQSVTVESAFAFSVSGDVPDGHTIELNVVAGNGDTTWTSVCTVDAHAPILQYFDFSISDPSGNNNGRLDPGETAQLMITVKNVGTSEAYDVRGYLTSSDQYITMLSDTTIFGDLPQNNTIQQSFNVTTSVISPPGHEAGFDVGFMAQHGISTHGEFTTQVGHYPIVIIDIDENHNSGIQLKNRMDDWRIWAEYRNTFPDDLSGYSTVFLCLGTYNTNHVLTPQEAAPFIEYLNNGGTMYLEGADTWYYDMNFNPTGLQPMFKITGTDDGDDDIGSVKAVNGTFVDGFSFYFLGDNKYIDHITPVSPAYTIFQNLSPLYNVAVAYEGPAYRTIGSSFEFGGLNDNATYTKLMLMKKYLEFFGYQPITEKPAMPSGPTTICADGSMTEFSTQSIEGANYYIWELDPPEAGTVMGYTTDISVDWSNDYFGPVAISVCGMSPDGLGPVSDNLNVTISQAPQAEIILSSNVICEGDSTALEMALTGVSPWHMVVNFGTYQMEFDLVKPYFESIYLNPSESIEIQILSLTDGSGCENTNFSPVMITVDPLPMTPAVPAGPAEIDSYSVTQSTYTTAGATYADSYLWSLEPAEAGSVSAGGTQMSCTIDWNTGYKGQATVKVSGVNDCGPSANAAVKTVNVTNSTGIDENDAGLTLSVFPNPNEGSFTVNISSADQQRTNIWINNAFGTRIWEKQEVSIMKPVSLTVNLEGAAEGIYFLNVETPKGIVTQKIMINK